MAPSPCLMPAHPPQRRRLSPSPSVSLDAWHGMAWHGSTCEGSSPPAGLDLLEAARRRISKAARTEHRRQRSGQRFVGLRPVDIINICRAPNSAFFPRAGAANALGAGPRRAGGRMSRGTPWPACARPELPTPVPFPASVEEAWCHQPSPTGISFLIDMGFLISNGGGHGSRLRHGSKTRA